MLLTRVSAPVRNPRLADECPDGYYMAPGSKLCMYKRTQCGRTYVKGAQGYSTPSPSPGSPPIYLSNRYYEFGQGGHIGPSASRAGHTTGFLMPPEFLFPLERDGTHFI